MPDGGVVMDSGGCSEGETRDCIADAVGECANGTETCSGGVFGACVAGAAVAELCDGLDNDCDGTPDGAAASAACEDLPQTGSSVCTAGTCVIAECDDGFDDCNDDSMDGCEVELATTAAHCGTCGNACVGADFCADSDCVSPPLHEWSISLQSSVLDLIDVAVDDDQNIYASGEYIVSLTVSGTTRTGTLGSREGFLLSLTPNGVLRWMVTLNGGGFDSVNAVTPMPDGSVCLAGRFEHPATFIDSAGVESSLTSVGSTTALLACVDSAGRRVFTERFGGSGISVFRDIAVDSASNLYVTGRFTGTVDFGTPRPSRGGEDVIVASYESDGTYRWSRSFGSSLQDRGSALAVRGTDLYVGGDFNQSIDFGGETLTADARGAYLAHFDTDGNHVASVAYGPAPRNGIVRDLRATASGQIVVAGHFNGPTDLFGLDRDSTNQDGYVAIIDEGLMASTIVQLEGAGSNTWGGVAEVGGLLVFAGTYRAGAILDGVALPNRGNGDALIAGFDSDVAWYATYGGSEGEGASCVVESGFNHVILGGNHGGASFGGSVLDPGAGGGGVVAKYRVR